MLKNRVPKKINKNTDNLSRAFWETVTVAVVMMAAATAAAAPVFSVFTKYSENVKKVAQRAYVKHHFWENVNRILIRK